MSSGNGQRGRRRAATGLQASLRGSTIQSARRQRLGLGCWGPGQVAREAQPCGPSVRPEAHSPQLSPYSKGLGPDLSHMRPQSHSLPPTDLTATNL